MRATFIDCYVKDDKIVLWLKQGQKNIKLVDRFIPNLIVGGANLSALQKKFMRHGIISFIAKRKSFFHSKEVGVLSIPVYNLSRYHQLINYLEELQEYAIEIYNADLKIEEAYIFSKNLFPTAQVEFTQENGHLQSIRALDDPENIDYSLPEFTVGSLQISTSDSLSKTLDTELKELTYNNVKFAGDIKDILIQFKKAFERQDPDLIWTEHGNLVLPYLKKQFEKHGISFNFNRFEADDVEYAKGDSYWAYTNIIYRTASVFLKGRLHFDTESFFADDTGFYGIIDAARICRQRIQRIAMRSAGAAVTNLLLYESNKRNFLLPYKVGIIERFKTLGQLYEADRGSIIFEPRVGFHTEVVELDFISLYPQIMWKYNLSPETLFCRCCSFNKVPGLHYNFCLNQRGIVSVVAEYLIKRRVALKKIGTPEAKEKASYLKWMLVTMFGYQAFKNRKIGTIEIHESIQAYARELILQAVRIAESRGWEVVHGIVDSIYVKKKGYTQEDVDKLRSKICVETGFDIALEGNYKWIIFLPSIEEENQPVSNHFYGVLENGDLKCRGIEVRKKDTPLIVASMQTEMIHLMAQAKTKEELCSLFPKLFVILNNYVKKLPFVSANDLTIIKRLSKTDYVHNIPQKILLDLMREDGWEINPGQKIKYIIRDVNNHNPKKRYIPVESFDGKFDIEKYSELMVRATFNILQPFGVSENEIAEKIKKIKQLTLNL